MVWRGRAHEPTRPWFPPMACSIALDPKRQSRRFCYCAPSARHLHLSPSVPPCPGHGSDTSSKVVNDGLLENRRARVNGDSVEHPLAPTEPFDELETFEEDGEAPLHADFSTRS